MKFTKENVKNVIADWFWQEGNSELSDLADRIEKLNDSEKVVVSKEFDEWVNCAKKHHGDFRGWCVKKIAAMGWDNWLHNPKHEVKYSYETLWIKEVATRQEDHIKAIYNGYEVEKEPYWIVKAQDKYIYYSTSNTGIAIKLTNISAATPFSKKEVANSVAFLMGGEVEEVAE